MYYEREGEISRSLFEREGERLRLIKLARYFTTVTVVRVEGRGGVTGYRSAYVVGL